MRCFDELGYLTDSRFTLSMAQQRSLGSPFAVGAYMHMDQPTAASSNATAETSWNSESAGVPFTNRDATGVYRVYLWNMAGRYTRSTALVTAESHAGHTCSVKGWKDVWTFTEVTVNCFSAWGSPRDAEFHLTFVGNER